MKNIIPILDSILKRFQEAKELLQQGEGFKACLSNTLANVAGGIAVLINKKLHGVVAENEFT
jgi:hypothetical protein